MQTIEIPVWPYVYVQPAGQGNIRSVPQDFVVKENLSFEPSGTGEHVFLQIEKTQVYSFLSSKLTSGLIKIFLTVLGCQLHCLSDLENLVVILFSLR